MNKVSERRYQFATKQISTTVSKRDRSLKAILTERTPRVEGADAGMSLEEAR